MQSISDAQISNLLGRQLRSWLNESEGERRRPMNDDELAEYMEVLRQFQGDARESLALGDYSGVRDWADEVLREAGLSLAPSAPEYRQICRGLLQVRLLGLEIDRQLTVTDYHETPEPALACC